MSILEVLENSTPGFGGNAANAPAAGKSDSEPSGDWSTPEKFGFRVAAVFFALAFAAPLDWKFWREVFHSHWTHFQDLFQLTAAVPRYVSAPQWGFWSFRNVYLVLLIAVIAAIAWSYLDRRRREYNVLYYWLNVFLRYRLAIGLIGYGLLQLFPIQFPKPTLSDLYTNYGDYLQWKLYYLTNGIAHAHYEEFLGAMVVLGGALLLWRTTMTIGAIISASLLVNIVLANFAYQLGDQVYATLLLFAASFLLLYDAARLVNLLVLQRRAKADRFQPPFLGIGARRLHLAGKSAVIVFLALYGISVAYGFRHTNWPFPDTPGALKGATGYYNVSEFTVNGRTIPYSLTDPVRWENVVFEKWNTVSIRSHRPVPIEVVRPEIAYGNDQYEYAGNAGRRFYSYTVDLATQTLHLQGKNDPHESLWFHYQYAPDGALVLIGADERGNALRVVLQKMEKQYLLLLGRRHPLTIY